MRKIITTPCLPQSEIKTTEQLFDNWFDPIEASLHDRAREFSNQNLPDNGKPWLGTPPTGLGQAGRASEGDIVQSFYGRNQFTA
jgi:hypothetical protein